MKKKLIVGIACATLLLVVATCGCTNPVQNVTTSQQNNAVQFGNLWLQNLEKNPGPNSKATGNVVANGSDGAQVSITLVNKTPDGIWSNGTTITFAMSIKQYSSTDDANAAYNQMTFGYTQNDSSMHGNSPTNNVDVYKTVTGHDATVTHAATKIDQISFFGADADIAMQINEFVVWGAMNVVAGS